MSPDRSRAYYRVLAPLLGASGVLLALGASPALVEPARLFVDLVFWPLDGAETIDTPAARLLAAVSGGLTAGFAAAIWVVATHLLPREPGLARQIIGGMTVAWFATDSTGSLLAGSPGNVVANVAVAAVLLWPWLRAERAAA